MAAGKGGKDSAGLTAWFAPDTNFFLQCKPASDVDWSLVTDASEVVLVAVRTVQREIDSHKGSGNQRRADRARAVAPIFKTLLRDDAVHVFRQANPRVIMRRGPRLDPSRPKPADFDAESNDDQIVEQVMATAAHLDQAISLLTHDSGPMQTAHDLGVPFIEIPDDWFLPRETGAEEKQIAVLQREILDLKRTMPVLEVTPVGAVGPASEMVASADYFGGVDRALKKRVMRAVTAKHPSATRGMLGMSGMYSDKLVEEYEQSYDAWTKEARECIEKVARRAQAMTTVEFKLRLANAGRSSADGVVVKITSNGPFNLVPLDVLRSLNTEDRLFPTPPPAPSLFGGLADYMNKGPLLDRSIFSLSNLGGPAPSRNPRAFFWNWLEGDDRPEIRGECEEFRHGIHTEEMSIPLWVPLEHEGDARGVVSVTLSARNLPQPQVTHHKVLIRRTAGDLQAVLRQRLKQDLGVVLP